MLEVIATLDREVAIYLAGETIRVTVTVSNLSRGKQGLSEQLAWGSLQFICERTIGATSYSTSSTTSRPRPTTSVTKSAATVYSSPPNILFCELQLGPGQSKQFFCDQISFQIPLSRNGIPPTFRGHLVKYSNRVTVAVSHVQEHIKSAHLPIRIIPSVGLETKMSLPANPFLTSTITRPSVVETVMATVDDLTQARKSLAFALTHNSSTSRVALLTLPKKAYKLGDDVCGFLDFNGATTPCVQYSATIETEEHLIDADVEEGKKKMVKVHCQTAPICTFSPDSTFRLSIPLTATPTFSTDSVQLKWKIRFVFVVTEQAYDVHLNDDVASSAAPIDVPVESFSWSTDLLVLPCKPQNAALIDNTFPNRISMTV
ncbi:hypothetical protein CRE_25167 [Caenorhabditis remanei]|uniref:Uncharacterized protein n=1 Tax=Caenorhabditis remanei TaxID=31234 RepID=E3LTA8_CAERE|nr:hypothetical protein CRE_25167 [Caenorhabditis remanei]